MTFQLHKHDRAIFALAFPALGALAADPIVSLVDTAFVGRLGAVPSSRAGRQHLGLLARVCSL